LSSAYNIKRLRIACVATSFMIMANRQIGNRRMGDGVMSMHPVASRPLGQTGLRVSEVGCGAASLGNLYQPVEDAAARATIDAAWNAGVRYFDTAPHYGFGLSERRVGDALRSMDRSAFVLSTKVGRLLAAAPHITDAAERHGFHSPMPFEPVYDYSYRGVMRSFEESLQRLGLARIDVLFIHDIGAVTHGAANGELFKICMEGGYKALDELRAKGLVGAIGLGVNEWEVCEAAMEHGRFDCFLLAGRYTLLEQGALDSFMPKCERHGATLIIGGAYNSGILATGTRRGDVMHFNYAPAPDAIVARVRRIEDVCDAYGVTLAAAALQFPLAHPVVSSVIPGLGSARRAAQTMELFHQSIPEAFWRTLKMQGLLREDAPIPSGAARGG
jgi:D-threo-aldose 1-dehydrogenase